MLDAEAAAAARDVAGWLNVPAGWLAGVIDFETAGTWSPTVRNQGSSAAGLLQFTDQAARELGYSSSAELVAAFPTAAAQLRGPVYQYLERYAPFPTLQSLAMAVFYPAARAWNPSQAFPAWVQSANPGIRTVDDYVRRVEEHVSRVAGAVGGALLGLTGGSTLASAVLVTLLGVLAVLLVLRR